MAGYCSLMALVTLLQKGICAYTSGTIDNCFHQSCPDYKPFCTPIGCVVSCPTNNFVNGSTCVTSCDHMFVGKNRQCLDECPSDHLIKEEIVNNGDIYRLDRYCVDSCDQFIYNRTCFPMCPKHVTYINNGHCVMECPPDKNIVRRFPQDKERLECIDDCGTGVFQDDICVANCSSYHYVFNQTCVKVCPKEAPLLLSEYGRETCRSECPTPTNGTGPYYIINGTCVSCCSELIYKNSCVSVCPDDEPFNIQTNMCVVSSKEFARVNRVCVRKCPDGMFISGTRCDPECPSSTTTVLDQVCNAPCSEKYPIAVQRPTSKSPHKKFFNCESRCPSVDQCLCSSNRPFLFNDSCISECPLHASLAKQRTFTLVCVPECDADELVYNNSCLKTCPVPSYKYNNSCYDHCPTRYALDIHTAHAGRDMCVDVCEWYVFNDSNCVERCPRIHQYTYNKTCLESCGTRYVDTSRLTCYDQCPSDRYLLNNSECVSQCPASRKSIYNRTCTDVCPSEAPFKKVVMATVGDYLPLEIECLKKCDLYVFNDTNCVDWCPISHRYSYNKTCLETCGTKYVDTPRVTCYDQCPSDRYLFNDSQCVSQCPPSHNYIYNRTCVDIPCYTKYSLVHQQTPNVHCVGVCPKHTFILNSQTCVDKCPHVNFKSKCYDACPSEASFLELGINCIESCSQYVLNKTCVSDCPKDERFLHNKRCVRKCPPGTVITNTVYLKSLTNCLDKCPSNKLNMNGTCIFKFECDDPKIIFNDECLVECPEHYVLIGTCIHTIVFCILTTICWTALIALFINQRNQRRNLIQLICYSSLYKKTKVFNDPRLKTSGGRRQTRESRVNFNENDDEIPLLQLDDTASHTENVDAIPAIEEICV